jgi:aspartyl-tRNA(Asn)/glutamyl-tRNA(Gln) amidotransferase subunit A
MKPFITIRELNHLIETHELSVAEVVKHFADRCAQQNPKVKALLESWADKIDLEALPEKGILYGIPGVLKDNICNEGHTTSAGSRILENYVAPYDATVSARLKNEGAVIIGRANMDEFAMGSSGEFSGYQVTINPWNEQRSPGGSSSGSAAAVAAGMVPWAIGTETGGSVRQPAAFCNLVGLYPTYGLFSRYGIMAFGSSLDQPGPLTHTVYDNALVASAMSGHDSKDSTSLPEPKRDYTKKLDGKMPEGITIGVLRDALESDGVHPEIRESFKEAVHQLEKLGAKISYIDMPAFKYGISVYFILSRAEAASNLARFDGSLYGMREKDVHDLQEMYLMTREHKFGAEVKRRILMGNYVLGSSQKDAYYDQAQRVRGVLNAEFADAFNAVDVMIAPTTSTLAFELGKESNDPLAMYMNDYFTLPNCVTGMPGLSVPCGMSKSGLPIGFQFIGPRLSEELLYRVAHTYEIHTPHHLKKPLGYE